MVVSDFLLLNIHLLCKIDSIYFHLPEYEIVRNVYLTEVWDLLVKLPQSQINIGIKFERLAVFFTFEFLKILYHACHVTLAYRAVVTYNVNYMLFRNMLKVKF